MVSSRCESSKRMTSKRAAIDFDALIEKSRIETVFMAKRNSIVLHRRVSVEAEKQFRLDTKVNPNDTEEAAWAFLSRW